jgi:hypothetical protein
MLHDNLQKAKETKTEKEQNELLEIQATLDEYKNILATNLGRIVLPSMKQFES